MLTSAELTALQSVQELTMTDTATIFRYATVSDGAGGTTETVTTSSVACRLAPSNNAALAQLYAGRIDEGILWYIYLPTDTDVQEEDRITIGLNSFDILGKRAPYTLETAIRLDCMERDYIP